MKLSMDLCAPLPRIKLLKCHYALSPQVRADGLLEVGRIPGLPYLMNWPSVTKVLELENSMDPNCPGS